MIKVGLDHTIFIQIIQFLFVVFLTNKLIIKPIKGTMDIRDAKIKGLMKSAEESLKSVEESRLAYEAKLREFRSEISDYRRKVKDETDAQVSAAVSKAKKEIAVSTSNARQELDLAIGEAKKELEKDVKSLSDMIYKTISDSAA